MIFQKIITLFIISFCLAIHVFGQEGFTYNSTPTMTVSKAGTVNLFSISEDFFPALRNIEMPKPGGEKYSSYLQEIKDNIPAAKPYKSSLNKKGNIEKPLKLRNFEGNALNGIPNDNNIAISNDGKIVSVTNSIISIYDTSGAQLKVVSLSALSSPLGLKPTKYDPKVLYDQGTDRFIMVFLSGTSDSITNTIIAFSKTNDPTAEWNLYSLPGNPLKNKTWADYPSIGISKDELFISLNTFYNGSVNNSGFKESVFWQIDKSQGYNGDSSLSIKYYYDILGSSKSIFNITPIPGGRTLYGPNFYLLSNRNLSASNDTIFLLETTGKLADPNLKLKINIIKSPVKYGVPPSAPQTKFLKLTTLDTRILSGFIENGKIQFVGGTIDTSTNLAGIYHGIISDLNKTPTINFNIISDSSLYLAYPAIAYAGKNSFDDDAIILANHVSQFVFPGNSAYFFKAQNYSDPVILKTGISQIQLMSGSLQRWGDYSGIQPKYNEPGKVWSSATFGKKTGSGPTTAYIYGTWISEIQIPSELSSVKEPETATTNKAKTYPSPVFNYEPLNVEFELEKTAYLSFSVYDMSGKEIKQVLRERAKAGKNLFSFNINALKPGQYILRITDTDNKAVVAKAFVVR